jgi:hypothetical protein
MKEAPEFEMDRFVLLAPTFDHGVVVKSGAALEVPNRGRIEGILDICSGKEGARCPL